MSATLTTTDTEKARAHYEGVLAEAIAAPVIVPLDVTDIDVLEVCNSEAGDRFETFELGPFAGNRYLRVRSTDAVALAVVLRALADDALDGAFDAREEKARAEQVECPGCRTRIAPDDTSCGTVRCERIAHAEASI